jgi:hypothetical protein
MRMRMRDKTSLCISYVQRSQSRCRDAMAETAMGTTDTRHLQPALKPVACGSPRVEAHRTRTHAHTHAHACSPPQPRHHSRCALRLPKARSRRHRHAWSNTPSSTRCGGLRCPRSCSCSCSSLCLRLDRRRLGRSSATLTRFSGFPRGADGVAVGYQLKDESR